MGGLRVDSGGLTCFAQSGGVGSAKSEAEIVHRDGKEIEHFGIDGLLLKIDQIHALTNLLQSSLGAESSKIRANITVGFVGNLLKVNVSSQLHVLGVNAHDLETAGGIRDTDVNLTIEATEATQSLVNQKKARGIIGGIVNRLNSWGILVGTYGIQAVGAVGGSHDDDLRALL